MNYALRMGKSPAEMLSKILENLEQRTGKGVKAWAAVAKKAGHATRKERVEWLMKEHGIGRVAANLIADEVEGKRADYSDSAGMVEAMFAGRKAALRPVYEELLKAAQGLGKDVEVVTCRTMVTLRRRRQFAWVKPSTATRLDLGLALPGVEPGGRLERVAGTDEDDRVRLRIPLTAPRDIDAEVRRRLKQAYEMDAG